ncbi:MAG TPA: T9SS type A sorting domain-containing protein [Chitinophagales bacterium]|nr:T9SS type A sorting domain-containing protein [Chitinophagales bacterium]
MKKFYLLCFMLVFFAAAHTTYAQVSITGSDLPAVGVSKYLATSNTPDIDLGTASATAQVWNFTSLTPGNFEAVQFITPTDLPAAADFPQATIARVGNINSVLGVSLGNILPVGGIPDATAYYTKNTQGKVFIDGFTVNITIPGIIDLGATNVNASPNDLYLSPANYGEAISGNGGYIIPIDFNGTQIGLRLNVEKSINADAFGTLQLPDFTLEVLRYNETNTVGLELGLIVFGNFVPIDPALIEGLLGIELPFDPSILDTTIVTNSMRFISKNQGYPAASITLITDPLSGNVSPASIEYLAQPGPLLAEFNFNANCLTVAFTNASANAFSYEWNFGVPGESSALENPIFTFPAPGTYTVTLTTLGVGGTTATVTKEVTVDYCTGIEPGTATNSPRLYPNPTATGQVVIQLPNTLPNSSLYLYNTLGQEVAAWHNLSGTTTLTVNQLPKGLYFYTLVNAGSNINNKGKLIIE